MDGKFRGWAHPHGQGWVPLVGSKRRYPRGVHRVLARGSTGQPLGRNRRQGALPRHAWGLPSLCRPLHPRGVIDRVLALYEDREGALWIGTYGNGLARLKNGEVTRYGKDEGVPFGDDLCHRRRSCGKALDRDRGRGHQAPGEQPLQGLQDRTGVGPQHRVLHPARPRTALFGSDSWRPHAVQERQVHEHHPRPGALRRSRLPDPRGRRRALLDELQPRDLPRREEGPRRCGGRSSASRWSRSPTERATGCG